MDNWLRINRAIVAGKIHILKQCDLYGKDIRNLALLRAAYYGQIKIAKFLIEKGAKASFRESKCLELAAMSGQVKMFHLLLENGADLFAGENYLKENPHYMFTNSFYWACHSKCFPLLQFMIDSGMNMYIDGNHPIREAVELANKKGDYSLLDFLFKNGMELQKVNSHIYGEAREWYDLNKEEIEKYKKRKAGSDVLEATLPKKAEPQKSRVAKI